MALIKCPECGKEISDRADACIHCGCPLENREIETQKKNTNIVYCYEKGIQNLFLRCSCGCEFKYMNTLYKRTILDNGDYKFEQGGLPVICPQCRGIYDTISFRAEASPYHNEKNIEIKCPSCNSLNVHRVTAGEKVTNVALFGLFGNKRKMQFKCNSCKYMW